MFENIKFKTLIPYFICFLLACVMVKMCDNNSDLKKELNASIQETEQLVKRTDSLNVINQNLLSEIDSYESEITELEDRINTLKNRKELIVEKVKYVEPVNDTIKTFIQIDSLNTGIIRDLEKLVAVQSIQIDNYKVVIENDELIKQQMSLAIKRKDEQIEAYNKQLKKAKNQNAALGTTTTLAVIGIILIALL